MRMKFLLALSLFSFSLSAQDTLMLKKDTIRMTQDSAEVIIATDSSIKENVLVLPEDSLNGALMEDEIFKTMKDSVVQDDLFDILEDDQPEKRKVFATFKSTYLINAQTNETVKKGTLDFRITHRFGDVAGSSGGIHNFYGFDNASNIRFSFDYGITDRLQLGIGRSKVNENVDGSVKYKFMEQVEKGFPLSIVGYANVAITPKKDVNTEFTAFANRMSYSYQLILAGKVSRGFSFELLPSYVHRNMIHAATNSNNGAEETNDIFSMGVLTRLKITPSFALIGEYFYTFSDFRKDNPDYPYYMPLGVGIEIETGGHVFQVNLTNTSGIINQDFIPTSTDNWLEGQYKLGFTISRVFGIVR